VIDFKTTQKSPGDLTPYLEHTIQLAAYREVLAPEARCANVYINGDTNEVAIFEHDEQDLRDGYQMFVNLVQIYKGVVIDFKTTQKSPGELTPYLENILQLSAYREVLAPEARCANVYINGDTNEVAIFEHDEQDLRDGYQMFVNLVQIYKLRNKLN